MLAVTIRAAREFRPVVSRSKAARACVCQLMPVTLSRGTDNSRAATPAAAGFRSRDPYAGGMREEYVEAVLAVVDLVPAGCVLAYGDVAELLGAGGPRQVGAVMSRYGGQTAWWRILKASGGPPEGHEAQALGRYIDERTPLRGDPHAGWRVDMPQARWTPSDEELEAVEAIAEALNRRLHGPEGPGRELSEPGSGMDP